jgi:hypothetical protein
MEPREAGRRELGWRPKTQRQSLELEFDLDRAPGRCEVAAANDTLNIAAPDPSCGFERLFGPDWRTTYPAIAGGIDEARRHRTSPTAPVDDPRQCGPPPGEQGSAFVP